MIFNCLCRLGNTIHWGSECSRLDSEDCKEGKGILPRASLAVVFRVKEFDHEAPKKPYVRSEIQRSGVRERAFKIAEALDFFTHWYSIPVELKQRMEIFRD